MKKTAIALSLMLSLGTASSALAFSYDDAEYGYTFGNGIAFGNGHEAFAQAPGIAGSQGLISEPVIADGVVIGRDPDINVRQQLERDYYYNNY
jgi:hypothetical protein